MQPHFTIFFQPHQTMFHEFFKTDNEYVLLLL